MLVGLLLAGLPAGALDHEDAQSLTVVRVYYDDIEQVRELAAGKRLYAHCKLGGRSAKALIALKREGIDGINVSGGIDAWSQEVDPSVQRY